MPGGIYFLATSNPFTLGVTETSWNGVGYLLNRPYLQSDLIVSQDAEWVYEEGKRPAPVETDSREYRHTLSNLLNSLFAEGFSLFHMSDSQHCNPDFGSEPGTWDHLASVAPPFLAYWMRRNSPITSEN